MPTTSNLSGINMRVLCKNLGRGDLLEAEVAHGFLRTTVFHVTVGREYAVYGLLFTGGVLHYLIYEDNLIPLWHPTSMFAVVCDRIPRCWRIANWSDSERDFVVVSFPEITESPLAFDSLVNGDREAHNVFRKREQLADLELPDPSVKQVARLLDADWLQFIFIILSCCSEESRRTLWPSSPDTRMRARSFAMLRMTRIGEVAWPL